MLYKSVLFLAPLLAVSFACSCLPTTQKRAFERANIVAHVTIVSKVNKTETSREYQIQYNETFKPKFPKNPRVIIPIPLPGSITTAKDSAACGVSGIHVGKEYLISGQRQNNTVFVSLCSGISPNDDQPSSSPGAYPWSQVTPELLQKLRNKFQ
ncbi:Proteinase inhibitor I35 domain containing protein [Aphelenchoides bicaudatus]|nr:Proteinase inhibitor I35 domain containing protein [Aphelenchoides bicaudatus]